MSVGQKRLKSSFWGNAQIFLKNNLLAFAKKLIDLYSFTLNVVQNSVLYDLQKLHVLQKSGFSVTT